MLISQPGWRWTMMKEVDQPVLLRQAQPLPVPAITTDEQQRHGQPETRIIETERNSLQQSVGPSHGIIPFGHYPCCYVPKTIEAVEKNASLSWFGLPARFGYTASF